MPTDSPVVAPLWLKIGAAVIVVLAMAGFAFRNALLGLRVDVQTVATAELRQSVVASGRVITPQRVSIAAEVTGRGSRVAVAEGQAVSRGQLLLELESADELAAVAQAGAAVAQAQLRQLREVGLPAAAAWSRAAP